MTLSALEPISSAKNKATIPSASIATANMICGKNLVTSYLSYHVIPVLPGPLKE